MEEFNQAVSELRKEAITKLKKYMGKPVLSSCGISKSVSAELSKKGYFVALRLFFDCIVLVVSTKEGEIISETITIGKTNKGILIELL